MNSILMLMLQCVLRQDLFCSFSVSLFKCYIVNHYRNGILNVSFISHCHSFYLLSFLYEYCLTGIVRLR